jgi:hypothetical protein
MGNHTDTERETIYPHAFDVMQQREKRDDHLLQRDRGELGFMSN